MKSLRYLVSTIILIYFSFFSLAHATVEEANFLRHVAEQYMLAQFPDDGSNVKIDVKAGRLDENRDYGGKCEGYLTAQLVGQQIRTSSQVKIICQKPEKSFTVLVPVQVKKLVPSVVAAVNIPRNGIITASMLEETYVDDATNVSSAVNDVNMLIGSKVKREIKAGEQIKQNSFCLVCKGDTVTIEALKGQLSLKTNGEALADGNYNDNIDVKNSKTKKVIQGRVTGAGLVRVQL